MAQKHRRRTGGGHTKELHLLSQCKSICRT